MGNMVDFWSYGNYSSDNYGAHTMAFRDTSGDIFYFSYDTLVGFETQGQRHVIKNYWGPTTGKHLNWIDGGSPRAKEKREDEETFNANYKACFSR